MENKVGIVFGGGGGKGAYQIGVLKALDEMGLLGLIKGVSGTSVGALNGAMFCAGNLDKAVGVWSSIREDMVLIRNDMHGKRSYNGWFSNSGLRLLIKRHVDLAAVKSSKAVFYATASHIKTPKTFYRYIKAHQEGNLFHRLVTGFLKDAITFTATARYFKTGDYDTGVIEDILLASAAIPFVFPDIIIDGEVYADGGIKDNVPVTPLYNDGFRKFLILALDTDYKFPSNKFPGAMFVELNLNEKDPLKSLADILDFTAQGAQARMKLGYEDCIGMADELFDFMHRD